MIKTEGEHDKMLVRAYGLMDAKPNTKEMEELKKLTKSIEEYEDKNYPIFEIHGNSHNSNPAEDTIAIVMTTLYFVVIAIVIVLCILGYA